MNKRFLHMEIDLDSLEPQMLKGLLEQILEKIILSKTERLAELEGGDDREVVYH